MKKSQVRGLFGELWFLSQWLFPSIGQERAITMWRGPAGARNDFELPGLATEVKTSGRLDGTHQIHGLEQLLEPQGGVLLFFSLLVREEASGAEHLPKLVSEIRGTLDSDHVLLSRFDAMLLAAGYEDVHAPEYEKARMRIRNQGLYRVSDGFPRLVPNSFTSGLPFGVANVHYELRLDAAVQWLLYESPATASAFISDLANGLGES